MPLSIIASFLTFLLTSREGRNISNGNSTLDAPAEVCMEELGCFSYTDNVNSLLLRPYDVMPLDRAEINTRFHLFTRKNPNKSHLLITKEAQTFDESYFDPKNPVKFIVHGFLERLPLAMWTKGMKDELLIHGDYNIIIVDWSGGNQPPYFLATSNSRVVGAELALFIETLEEYKGIRREDVHIIGHSLGAHIAGYAGERLKTLGRITGCDPAMPYFQDKPPSARLDPTDADFVDVIHTDSTDIIFIGYGMSQKVGHVDFYPNGGENQPGCKIDISNGLAAEIRNFAVCDHQRSVELFHHSINNRKIIPIGYECSGWEDFLGGKCADCGSETERCAIMGLRADEYYKHKNSSVQRAFYLKTGPKPPFWVYNYHVNIKLYKPQISYKDVTGTIELTLFGSNASALTPIHTKPTDLYMGAEYQYIVTTERDLGEIRNVGLKWYSASKNPINLIRRPRLYVECIHVIPMNVIEISPRNMTNRVFCKTSSEGIKPNTIATFSNDNA